MDGIHDYAPNSLHKNFDVIGHLCTWHLPVYLLAQQTHTFDPQFHIIKKCLAQQLPLVIILIGFVKRQPFQVLLRHQQVLPYLHVPDLKGLSWANKQHLLHNLVSLSRLLCY